MIFNSLEFLVFFLIVIVLYFILPNKYKWILLLLASYYFYMSWKFEYIFLMLFSTIINYLIALAMEKEEIRIKRKKYLYLSLILNIGILFVFKYFNFFIDSINGLVSISNIKISIPAIGLVLPMGISFYTFQTLSYTIDVYKGDIKAEKNFGIFALYISFFPQLVAGPIERADRLLPQFYNKHEFNYDNVTNGLKRMTWGFFKKIVIADRIAVMVNTVYNDPTQYKGLPLIIATIAFAIQIYCDFSGYSDIAIGSAKIMGFTLMENFKRPYFSKSISEFWKRWHISLSSWFRDYLYIPLGGNRVKISRAYFNLFITFLISGLWHGANWTFVLWGAIHGAYLVLGKMLSPYRKMMVKITRIDKLPFIYKTIQIIITNILVGFAWIFFRANTINDAIYIIKNLFVNFTKEFNISTIINILFNMGLNNIDTLIILLSVVILFIVSVLQRKESILKKLSNMPLIIRYSLYYGILIYIIFFSYIGNSEFIYFQF